MSCPVHFSDLNCPGQHIVQTRAMSSPGHCPICPVQLSVQSSALASRAQSSPTHCSVQYAVQSSTLSNLVGTRPVRHDIQTSTPSSQAHCPVKYPVQSSTLFSRPVSRPVQCWVLTGPVQTRALSSTTEHCTVVHCPGQQTAQTVHCRVQHWSVVLCPALS